MNHSLRSRSNSKSLSKIEEELDKLIEDEINNKNKLLFKMFNLINLIIYFI